MELKSCPNCSGRVHLLDVGVIKFKTTEPLLICKNCKSYAYGSTVDFRGFGDKLE